MSLLSFFVSEDVNRVTIFVFSGKQKLVRSSFNLDASSSVLSYPVLFATFSKVLSRAIFNTAARVLGGGRGIAVPLMMLHDSHDNVQFSIAMSEGESKRTIRNVFLSFVQSCPLKDLFPQKETGILSSSQSILWMMIFFRRGSIVISAAKSVQ